MEQKGLLVRKVAGSTAEIYLVAFFWSLLMTI